MFDFITKIMILDEELPEGFYVYMAPSGARYAFGYMTNYQLFRVFLKYELGIFITKKWKWFLIDKPRLRHFLCFHKFERQYKDSELCFKCLKRRSPK